MPARVPLPCKITSQLQFKETATISNSAAKVRFVIEFYNVKKFFPLKFSWFSLCSFETSIAAFYDDFRAPHSNKNLKQKLLFMFKTS